MWELLLKIVVMSRKPDTLFLDLYQKNPLFLSPVFDRKGLILRLIKFLIPDTILLPFSAKLKIYHIRPTLLMSENDRKLVKMTENE